MKYVIYLVEIFTICLSMSLASAHNKVVVIPLNSSKYVPGGVTTVTSVGQVWMDRNLGALRVASKSADPDSYGTLYQWGRGGDGHEYRSSSIISSRSNSDVPDHGSFIVGLFTDWRNPAKNNLWQGESGINNPCPAGFRLPTAAEWERERASWSTQDPAGAFASPLKLPAAGYRSYISGALNLAGSSGYYWSGTVRDGGSHYLVVGSGGGAILNGPRGQGFSVRCFED
jgi:uncharacterized protein (TIGR02145 family)